MGRKSKIKKAIKEKNKETEAKEKMEKFVKKAQAVKATDKDYQKEISGKKVQFVHDQDDYRENHLKRVREEEKLFALREKIKKYEGATELYWIGAIYPIEYLKAECNLGLFYFGRLLRHERESRRKLEKVWKMSEDEINDVLLGKYKKVLSDEMAAKIKPAGVEYAG